MKYRALKPFLAFGKAPQMGELVDLTAEQAQALRDEELVAPYEIKVKPKPENKAAKKPSGLSQAAPASRKKTAKRSKRIAKK